MSAQYTSMQVKEEKYFDIRQTEKLYFYKNQLTFNKRQERTEQMKPLNTYYQPQRIVCKNINVNQKQPKWVCQTDDSNVEIHDYIINCEGKRGEYDFFVLEDSCYIEYNVLFKDRKYRNDDKDYYRYISAFDLFDEFFNNGQLRKSYKQLKPIKLNDLTFLVFNKGERTTSKKGEYFPQLYQMKGNQYEPDQIVCRNVDFFGEKPTWKCTGYLPYPYKFSYAKVSCEGWNGPGDSNIVPGSCMLKYKVEKVEEKQKQTYREKVYQYENEEEYSFLGLVIELSIYAIFMIIIIHALIKCCKKNNQNPDEKKNNKKTVHVHVEESDSDNIKHEYHYKYEYQHAPEIVIPQPPQNEVVVIKKPQKKNVIVIEKQKNPDVIIIDKQSNNQKKAEKDENSEETKKRQEIYATTEVR